jgi:hypothetical protein
MNLRSMVVDMITERGCGTVDHLMPDLSQLGFTRLQVIKALHNAREAGSLWCEHIRRAGMGRATARPAVYWPGKKPVSMYAQLQKPGARQPVASVWELGTPKPDDAWPKEMKPGTTYTPLGPWHSKELEEA